MLFSSTRALLAALALIHGSAAAAATLRWPGVGACATSLQQCVNSAATGDVVEIASNTVINESLSSETSLTIRAAFGYTPHLAAGRSLTMGSSLVSTDYTLALDGLTLDSGTVRVVHTVARSATIRIARMTLAVPANTTGIQVGSAIDRPMSVELYDNRLTASGPPGASTSGIAISRSAPGTATVSARLLFNRILTNAYTDAVAVELAAGDAAEYDVLGNSIHGGFSSGIVVVASGATASTRANLISNVVAGLRGVALGIDANDSNVSVNVLNNTLVCGDVGIELTVRHDLGGALGGVVENNLVAFNGDTSISIDPNSTITNRSNLVYSNRLDSFVAGPGTLRTDPRLLHPQRPRARSPLIRDVGSRIAMDAVLSARRLPKVDVGGSRRFKGSNGIDIGAYEFGDYGLLHRAQAPSGNVTVIAAPPPEAQLDSTARFQMTPNWNPVGSSGVYLEHYSGLYFEESNRWALFTEDLAPMPAGASFNLFRPLAGDEVFGHFANAANTLGAGTAIDNAAVNGDSEKFLLVAHHWNGHGSPGVYNDHATGAQFFAGRWSIRNLDAANPMPLNIGFNVYAQDSSPNAYAHTVADGNRFSNFSLLDHPLLNGNSCARVLVTAKVVAGVVNNQPVGVFYSEAAQRWAIFNQRPVGATLPAPPLGATYNVLVDEGQIDRECADELYADSYEDPRGS